MSIEPINTKSAPRPGEVLLQAGLATDAIAHLLNDIQSEPTQWRHRLNLGVALRLAGRYKEAHQRLDEAEIMAPKAWPVHHTRANLLDDEGRFMEALRERAEAWELSKGKSREVALGVAVGLLRQGAWREGWRFWEIGRLGYSWSPPPGTKIADGKSLEGKRVLVLTEGGYGDVFQNSRWLPTLIEMGAKVNFHVWKRQIPLLMTSPELEGVEFSPAGEEVDVGSYDCVTSLLSLPAILDVTPDKVPPPVTFHVEPLTPKNGHRTLGLAWRAEEMSSHRKLRTIPMELLEPFRSVEGEWQSLVPKETLPWMKPSPENWLDTARAMVTLDKVVAVDSAVVHLAGCLRIPTTMVLPVCAEWRWGTGEYALPWYENMRIVRAKQPDEWKQVIEEAVKLVN